MTASRDPERLIHAFVLRGREQLDDQVYDAVRAEIEQKRQRAVIGPWRVPTMSKLVPIGLGAAALVVVLFVGAQLFGSPNTGVGAIPPPRQLRSATPEPTPTASADANQRSLRTDRPTIRRMPTRRSPSPSRPDGASWILPAYRQ